MRQGLLCSSIQMIFLTPAEIKRSASRYDKMTKN